MIKPRPTIFRLGLAISVGVVLSGAVPASSFGQCVVTDGTARAGARVGSNPVRFQYEATPYIGARADTCRGDVRVYVGGTKFSYFEGSERFRVNYGQRRSK